VGNLGFVYSLHPNLRLVTTVSSAFRAPNINDVSSFGMADFRYEIPNFSLKPERSIHADVGIKAKFNNSEFSLHNYLIKINGLIANEPFNYNGLDTIEGLQVYHKNNINESILKGFEAEGMFLLAAKWSVFGNLTYTYGKNISKNEPMRRIPPLYGRLGMLYNFHQGFNLRVDWIFAGKQTRLSSGDINDDRIAAGGTAAWQVINLVSSLNIGNHQIKLGLQNLLNKGYRVHGSGVDGIGRSVWISLLAMISN
jgi:iron complex outermembrane receptor protein/hemoglobin/transferrin/lactoferrin receptor protein